LLFNDAIETMLQEDEELTSKRDDGKLAEQ